MSEGVDSENPFADYEYWFAKDHWSIEEAAAIVIGLNPNVVNKPETAERYKDYDPRDEISYKLWQYAEQFGWMGDWPEILEKSYKQLHGDYCAGQLDKFINNDLSIGKPMDFIQWYVDEGYPIHYALTEYLKSIGYDFRHSLNSSTLYEWQIYAKKDIWWLPYAVRIILGYSIESTKFHLSLRSNFYRHVDANYSLTQRDEVYHVMEAALESWKTKNLEFFDLGDGDPEDGDFFDLENCSVNVEAKKFVEWAIKKGFTPPEQLLELMGLKAPKIVERNGPTLKREVSTSYCTQEMQLLSDAASKFWSHYDLTKPDQNKAPLKRDVMAWLIKEAEVRGFYISKSSASAIDTIIRCPVARQGGNSF